jgi:hypothetical protein
MGHTQNGPLIFSIIRSHVYLVGCIFREKNPLDLSAVRFISYETEKKEDVLPSLTIIK